MAPSTCLERIRRPVDYDEVLALAAGGHPAAAAVVDAASELRTMRAAGAGPDFYDVGRGLIRYLRESVGTFAETLPHSVYAPE